MKEKTRIIIAESENIIVTDLQETLKEAGYTVIATAATGEEAIEKVKELKPDIIILDIYLNGEIDGRTAARKIKEFSDTKIMFYSTCKDMQTMDDIHAVIDQPIINPEKVLFGLEVEKNLISNVEKIIK